MLKEERDYYDEHLSTWLEEYPGEIVLIKGQELVGRYATEDEAVRDGVRRFGLESFLIRRVQRASQKVNMPALTLGLISANRPLTDQP